MVVKQNLGIVSKNKISKNANYNDDCITSIASHLAILCCGFCAKTRDLYIQLDGKVISHPLRKRNA